MTHPTGARQPRRQNQGNRQHVCAEVVYRRKFPISPTSLPSIDKAGTRSKRQSRMDKNQESELKIRTFANGKQKLKSQGITLFGVYYVPRARPLFCVIVFLSLSLSVGFAQQCAKSPPEGQNSSTASSASSTATPQEREFGIQDNSFLVEEAYNQEFGVVQHIQSFQRLWNRGDWAYTFTQEWPVDPSPRNQLSYTLTAFHSGDQPGTGGGFGDVILNYRYQALGSAESTLAFSPRLSVLFPTGDASLGRGQGGAGLQTMLPMSLLLTKSIATHWNAGATFIPHARNSAGDRATTFGYNFGQSFAWLVRPRFNVLLETVFYRNQRVTANDRTVWNSDLFLNPGIRWAYNFHNGLQIVPGIAIPVGVGSSSGTRGVFLYLSFEHPYRKLPKKSSP